MTKQRIYGIGGEKSGIFPLTFCTTTYYTIHLPQICPSPSKNPYPISSIENLNTLKTPDSVSPKAGFARIRYALQSLYKRNLKALFKGKSKRDRVFCGEGKVLPRLMGRVFEWDQPALLLDSYSEVKMPIKTSENESLKGMDTNQGMEKEKPQECSVDEGWEYKGVEKPMTMYICNKGLWNNYKSAILVKKRKCSVDAGLKARGGREGMYFYSQMIE